MRRLIVPDTRAAERLTSSHSLPGYLPDGPLAVCFLLWLSLFMLPAIPFNRQVHNSIPMSNWLSYI
ncbi:hypothetical protein BDV30DRAFT_44102 [Aspergillus minisclerotigenes]|uniref:Uncharacterized protein n=1 Tax=Aspergillus minisclerotigenes TaxID=656917 RepID=A0A5N6IN00_9EURO|nr:hypothetical protein BDV30DRAFT_44102 [Aspergillus minisclerotigenes]